MRKVIKYGYMRRYVNKGLNLFSIPEIIIFMYIIKRKGIFFRFYDKMLSGNERCKNTLL